MPELDEIAGSRRYFGSKAWRGKFGSFKYKAIVRAIKELGGTLKVEWPAD
jgi:hypothetical protein